MTLSEQLKQALEKRAAEQQKVDGFSEKTEKRTFDSKTDGPALDAALSEIRSLNDEIKRIEGLIENQRNKQTWNTSTTAEPGTAVNVNFIAQRKKDDERAFAENYSLVRAIRSIVANKPLEGLEAEMHQEGVKEARTAKVDLQGNGFIIPGYYGRYMQERLESEMQKRSQSVGTAGNGGYTVATNLGQLIPFLNPNMPVRQLGATFLTGLEGNLDLPRQTGRATGGWNTEAGALSSSTSTFDKISLTPKRLGTYMDLTTQLINQSSLAIENLILSDLNECVARALETAAINGSGSSNQPTGILNLSGLTIEAVGTNGGPMTWSNIVNMESNLSSANALMGKTAYLTTPGIAGKLKTTQTVSGVASPFIWQGPNDGRGTVNGYMAMTSTLVPSTLTKGTSSGTCHAAIFGNWEELLIGQWGGVQVIVDQYTQATAGTVRLVVNSYWDVNCRHTASFTACVDAKTS